MTFVRSNNISLRYQMFTTLDYKDIGIIKSEFVAKTQFLSFEKYVPEHLISLLYNFYFIFRRRYLIILKKSILKTSHPNS